MVKSYCSSQLDVLEGILSDICNDEKICFFISIFSFSGKLYFSLSSILLSMVLFNLINQQKSLTMTHKAGLFYILIQAKQ
jgi:hypothetical protein